MDQDHHVIHSPWLSACYNFNETIFCHDREMLSGIPVRWHFSNKPLLTTAFWHSILADGRVEYFGVDFCQHPHLTHNHTFLPLSVQNRPITPWLGHISHPYHQPLPASHVRLANVSYPARRSAQALRNRTKDLHNKSRGPDMVSLVNIFHQNITIVWFSHRFLFSPISTEGRLIACKQNNDDLALMKWALCKVV